MNCVVYMDLRPPGKFSAEDDTHPGRPKTSVTKANITAVKIVVKQDA